MSTRPPRVFIIAPRHDEAVRIARELGYPPRGREAYLVSTGDRLRGVDLSPDDHIVWSRLGGYRPGQYTAIAENLAIAGLTLPADQLPTVEFWR